MSVSWKKNSIICDYSQKRWCFLTGDDSSPLDLHHLLTNSNRDFADREGLWIYLTHEKHMEIHQRDLATLRELKRIAQYYFEKTHSREEWMCNVRKNYLGDGGLTIAEKSKYNIQDTIELWDIRNDIVLKKEL